MDILDDTGVSKFSAKVNYSFKCLYNMCSFINFQCFFILFYGWLS